MPVFGSRSTSPYVGWRSVATTTSSPPRPTRRRPPSIDGSDSNSMRRPGMVSGELPGADRALRAERTTTTDQMPGAARHGIGSRTFLRLGEDYTTATSRAAHRPRHLPASDRYVGVPQRDLRIQRARGAGRVELYAADARRHYIDNRQFTETGRATRVWRRQLLARDAEAYLLAEARRPYQYKIARHSARPGDPSTQAFLEATALTTSTFKVGRMKREFDQPALRQRNELEATFPGPAHLLDV